VVPAALPVPSGSFSRIAEAVSPAVVNINTLTRGAAGRTPIEEFFGDEFFRRFFGDAPERQQQQRSLGSGVIVDSSGICLTNAHVVERATEIEVVTAEGKKHKAKVVGLDKRRTSPCCGSRAAVLIPPPRSAIPTRSRSATGCSPSARLRTPADGDGRHHQRQGPLHRAGQPVQRLHPDGRGHQSRQFWWTARQHVGRSDRHQQRHPLPVGR